MHLKNRRPELLLTENPRAALSAFEKLSKSDWCDLYFDLYRQVFGETETGEAVMADVASRIAILKRNRERAL